MREIEVNSNRVKVDVIGQSAGGRNLFLVPSFGYNRMLDDKSSVGVSVYGNGGMNTFYDDVDTFNLGGSLAGVDLMQLFVAPTYARKINDKVSVGVSALLAYQRFEAHGLEFEKAAALRDRITDLSDSIGKRLSDVPEKSPSQKRRGRRRGGEHLRANFGVDQAQAPSVRPSTRERSVARW